MTSISPTSSKPTSSVLLSTIQEYYKDLTLTSNSGIIQGNRIDFTNIVNLVNSQTTSINQQSLKELLVALTYADTVSVQFHKTILKIVELTSLTITEINVLQALQKIVPLANVVSDEILSGRIHNVLVALTNAVVTEQDASAFTDFVKEVALTLASTTQQDKQLDMFAELELLCNDLLGVSVVQTFEVEATLSQLHVLEGSINQALLKTVDLTKDTAIEYILNRIYYLGVELTKSDIVTLSTYNILVDMLSECRMVRVSYDDRTQTVLFSDRTTYKTC